MIRPKFRSRRRFLEEVRQYYEGCGFEQNWDPAGVILHAARVRVRAEIPWLPRDPVVEMTADTGAAFTAGELMYKVHNAFVALIRDSDHVFFEGLSLAEDQRRHGPTAVHGRRKATEDLPRYCRGPLPNHEPPSLSVSSSRLGPRRW